MPQDAEFDSAEYRLVAKKGEGTFSEVLKVQSIITGEYFATKCMKSSFKNMDQVNSLREIQALRRLNPHPNIIDLEEVLYDKGTGRLALVFELMDMNVYELIRGRKQPVKAATVKLLMYQLLKAVAHMHKHGIFHRDIKPENILIIDSQLKVADFGSCRGIYTQAPYTEYISTRWYRAPECLLTNGYYDFKMDIWGIGCVMFEVISLFPLFPGTNELDQVEKIHMILGTPPQEMLDKFRQHSSHIKNFNFPQKIGSGIARLVPHASADAIDLMERLLAYNPEHRITARQALRHAYFRELREAEKRERIRTASPKLGRSLHSSEADGAADEEEAEKEDGETPTQVSVKDKKKTTSKQSTTTTNSSNTAATAADNKKFPSIGASGTLPPANGATSNTSSTVATAATSGSTTTTMPSIHGKGTTDNLPSPADSPMNSTKKKDKSAQLLARKKAAAVAAAAAALEETSTHDLDHMVDQDDVHSSAATAGSIDEGGLNDDLATKERLALKAKEKQKELSLLKLQQQAQAQQAAAAQAASGGSQKNKAGGLSQHQHAALHKNSSTHKLLPNSMAAAALAYGGANTSAYLLAQQQQQQAAAAQYSALQMAANLSGGGSKKTGNSSTNAAKAHQAHAINMLPSIGGGVGINLNPNLAAGNNAGGYGSAQAALNAIQAHRAAQAAAAHPPTLASLKSSSSLASLHAQGHVIHHQHPPAQPHHHHLHSPNEDYSNEYYDDHPSDSSTNSALEHHYAAAAAVAAAAAAAHSGHGISHSKKGKAKRTKKTNPPAGGLLAAVQAPSNPPDHALSLSGHTATMTLHASSSTTQLRASKNASMANGKKGAAAAALSMALQSLDVGDSRHKKY